MMKNFNLLGGLFPDKNSEKEPAVTPAPKEAGVPTTKRTFKISNEYWDDFVDLAAAKKMTQADLINSLIETCVKENAELIERYREL